MDLGPAESRSLGIMSLRVAMRIRIALAVLIAVAAVPFDGIARGGILRVPEDHPTIQAAIEASVEGDVILVAAGVYTESVDFLGKPVTVRSSDGAEVTTIDAGWTGSVVTFDSGKAADSVIEGFTIRHGSGTRIASVTVGGGIYCRGSSPTIRGNRIIENRADLGGGVYCWQLASPTIEENLIARNSADWTGGGDGGGILCEEDAAPLIVGNTIEENTSTFRGGGIAGNFSAAPVILDNVIRGNNAPFAGGGIACTRDSMARIQGNRIVDNESGSDEL